MSANTVYASRKRRKPVQKSVKQVSAENAKSNPSKRHRDRLNGELELLASLLPFHQDVISKLDKLTVLRLSVGYLRAKSHFRAVLNKSNNTAKSEAKLQAEGLSEGELLLQVINGFVLVVTTSGTVFYVSSTVKDYLGFHQSDIVHQSIYKLVHTEDRAEFCRQLHWALNPSNSPDTGQIVQAPQNSHIPLTYYNPELLPPENSTFLERSFVCRMRCLLDNSSGFLAMNFQGRLKFLHGQNERTAEGKLIPPQLALFAVACPLQPPTILEIRAKNFFFRTKHKLDFTPTACDAKGKIVLGYTEAELCYRGSGYQFIHAADMLYCADNHIRMMKMGESGLTVFRLLTKHNGWVWVQANARLIYKNGRPDFIIASQRVLLDEEGEEHLKKRSLMLPFSLTTGEAVLYDASLPNSLGDAASGSDSVAAGDGNQPPPPGGLDPNSLLGSMLKQDESIYVCPAVPNNPRGFAPELEAEEEEEENIGAIFSCNLQDGVLSFSGSPFFKKESAFVSGAEESGSELLSFMGSLGISSEDLQLLRQDELFTNVDLDEFCTFEELTDELFSYVQESLRKKADGSLSGDFSAELEQRNLLRRASQTLTTSGFPSEVQEMFLPNHFTPQQHLPFFVEFSETTARPQESLPTEEQWQYHQGYTQAQAQPCILTSLAQPQELSRVPLQGQVVQSSSLQLSDTSNPRQQSFYPLNHKSLQPPELSCFVPTREQLCHRLKNMHVHGNGGIPVLDGEHLPPVVQHGLQKSGDLYLETPPMGLELPYGNQVNAEFITRNQELPSSYIPTGDVRMGELSAQELEELLHSLDGVGQSAELQREEWCPWKPAGEL